MKIDFLLIGITFVILFRNVCNFSQQQVRDYLSDPYTFAEDICSYRGTLVKENNQFKCICQPEYETSLRIRRNYIAGIPVFCDYEKKRTFVTLFLLLFFPYGAHFIYLEYTLAGECLFCLSVFVIIGNIVVIIKMDNQSDILKNKLCITLFVLSIILGIAWIVTIIDLLIRKYAIDVYRFKTFQDLDMYNYYY